MNIHRASLFPGLDGFGKSLRLELEWKEPELEALFAAQCRIATSPLAELRAGSVESGRM